MVLFIKHIDIEGPETLGQFFDQNRLSTRTLALYKQEPLPRDLESLEAVVSLGGPMNVYEEAKYPFLAEEDAFLKKVVAQKIPFLGICLGSQALAKSCGAKIGKSPEKEIGFSPVELTSEGKNDPLFQGLEDRFDVFQWHEDMWDVPPNGKLLAGSLACPHQAFKIGPAAYGLQFHVEVTALTIRTWAENYFSAEDPAQMKQKQRMLEDFTRKQTEFRRTADRIYSNFLSMIRR